MERKAVLKIAEKYLANSAEPRQFKTSGRKIHHKKCKKKNHKTNLRSVDYGLI
jgi:hypothetical protein